MRPEATFAQNNTKAKAPAQKNQKAKPSPEERAQKVSEYMTAELGLSADQQQKVSELNKAKATQISDIKAKYNGDMKAAMPEIKPIKQLPQQLGRLRQH